jgi:hypothetical protein
MSGTVTAQPPSATNEDQPQSLGDYQRSYGTNWDSNNFNTLYDWVNIAAYNISCLELLSDYYRAILRNHTIIGLIMSTLSGTLSVTQFGIASIPYLPLVINGVLTAFTFSIAIFTGALKVYQIHERLEESIKLKQQWILFSTGIASELQLPLALRRDAIYLINKNKGIYLDLLKADLEIPEWVLKKASADTSPHMKAKADKDRGIHFHRILYTIVENERKALGFDVRTAEYQS